MVAPVAARVASNTDGTMLLVGFGALVLLAKWGIPKIPLPKLPIKEAKEFSGGFLNQNRYTYAEDQSGSPNPPSAVWWMDEWETENPLPVGFVSQDYEGWRSTPTPPIMNVTEVTQAGNLGQDTNRWFTNKWLYPWFSAAEKILENASDQTNADRFRDYNTGTYQ